MNIAIIDADIVGKKKHRFPNLCCMKLSAYHKKLGDSVVLHTTYDCVDSFDKVYISKVFTDTVVPEYILDMPNVDYGGTGFFYDKAPPLPYEVEHIKPDYDLYVPWVDSCISNGCKRSEFDSYLNYSIGFLTRGCFRKCEFCVNKNSQGSCSASPVLEFLDVTRPNLCFLDDNFFACPNWKTLIEEVKATGKKFKFKQGLDERLLTEEKIHEIANWKYDGDLLFAFDNIDDSELIIKRLDLLYTLYPKFSKGLRFYVLCGFDRDGVYDKAFWKKDIEEVFKRIFILSKYSAIPYIMRYEACYKSDYAGMFVNLASWCNQVRYFRKMSFRTYSFCKGMNNDNYMKYRDDFTSYLADGHKKGLPWQRVEDYEKEFGPMNHFFDIIPDTLLEHGRGKKISG